MPNWVTTTYDVKYGPPAHRSDGDIQNSQNGDQFAALPIHHSMASIIVHVPDEFYDNSPVRLGLASCIVHLGGPAHISIFQGYVRHTVSP